MSTSMYSNLIPFLRHHFPNRENFPGYYLLSKSISFTDDDGKERTTMKNVRSVRSDRIDEEFSTLVFHKNCEYFITPNSYGCFKRVESDLRTLNNIVIDIDVHSLVYEFIPDIVNRLVYFLKEDLFSTFGFPYPSIVSTGRGIQLWFALESISPKWKKAYQNTANYLTEQIKTLIAGIPVLADSVQVDRSASIKVNGLFRLPFSYNWHSKNFGELLFVSGDRINLPEFVKEYIPAKRKRTKKNTKSKDLSYRLSILEKIRDYRIAEDSYIGHRNNLCFLYFCTCAASQDAKTSLEKTLEFNRCFPSPLSDGELKGYLKTAYQKAEEGENYKFKENTIKTILNISKEEEAFFTKRKKKEPSYTMLSSQEVKTILTLCKQGLNKSQIAQKIHRPVMTVVNVLRKYDTKTQKEKERIALIKDLEKGISWSQAKEKYSVSRAHFYRLRKEVQEGKLASENKKKEAKVKEEEIDKVIKELVEKGICTEKGLYSYTGIHPMTIRASLRRLYPKEWTSYVKKRKSIEYDLFKKIKEDIILQKYQITKKQLRKIKKNLTRKITDKASRRVRNPNHAYSIL